MSTEEKDNLINKIENRGKRLAIWYGLIHTAILIGAFFWMLERKGAEIWDAPNQNRKTVAKVDSGFHAHDSLHIRHEGLFSTIFNHIDTVKGYKH